MKRIIVLLSLMICTGCACSQTPKPSPSPSPSASPSVKEALDVTGEESQFGTPIVSLKMKDGKIIEISIDEITGETTKKAMKEDYKLPDTAVDTWANQVKVLEDAILNQGIDALQTDTDGRLMNADLKSGCTIQVENYLKTVRKAMNEAK